MIQDHTYFEKVKSCHFENILIFLKNDRKFSILFILILFAIIIEYQQYYISFRTYDIYDMSANVIGILTGVFYVILLDDK